MTDGRDRTHGLGRIGIWSTELRFGDPAAAADAAAELDALGYGAIWIPGGIGGPVLEAVAHLLDATPRIAIATGIINVYRHDPSEIAGWWHGRSAADHARLMLGVGVSHGPLIGEAYRRPLGMMRDYVAALTAAGIPADRLCVAANGPKMLELSRDLTAGAHPYLVSAAFTGPARAILGPDALLAPEVGVVVEDDPTRAREIARAGLAHYLHLPNYVNSWRRQGFTETDVTEANDALIDGLFAHGSADVIAERARAHLAAGADHVCLQVLQDRAAGMTPPLPAWRALAKALREEV